MRADAEAAGTLVNDDSLLAAAAHEAAHLPGSRNQGHNAGFVSALPAAEDGQAGTLGGSAQMIRQIQYSLANLCDADFQEQLHAGAQGGDAGDIEGAALPAAGVRFEPKIDARKIPRIHHAVPANPNGMQDIDQVAANVENAGPLRPQQPFVPVCCEKID